MTVLALLPPVFRHRDGAGPRLAAAAVPRAVLGAARLGGDPRLPALSAARAADEAAQGQGRLFGRHPHGAHAVLHHRADRRASASCSRSRWRMLIEYLRDRQFVDLPGHAGAAGEPIRSSGRVLAWLRRRCVRDRRAGRRAGSSSGAQTVLQGAAAVGGSVALGVVGTLVGFFLMLFLLFFLLRDGASMLMHADAARADGAATARPKLLHYLGDVIARGDLRPRAHRGHPGHAGRHRLRHRGAAVAGGVRACSRPSPPSFPRRAPGSCWSRRCIYLAVAGQLGLRRSSSACGACGVGFSDNFLRPYLTRQRAEVSTLTVFVGVIGGVAAFGFIGSLIGPVVLALIVALLQLR